MNHLLIHNTTYFFLKKSKKYPNVWSAKLGYLESNVYLEEMNYKYLYQEWPRNAILGIKRAVVYHQMQYMLLIIYPQINTLLFEFYIKLITLGMVWIQLWCTNV